jgi:hypothetical protein
MLRRFALVFLFVALFAVACGGGSASDENDSGGSAEPGPLAVDNDIYTHGDVGAPVIDDSPASGDAPPASVADDGGATNDEVGDFVLGALNPLQFLGGAASPAVSLEADPSLSGALLTLGDLPGGFQSMGDFSFSMPTEFGDIDMAARMFFVGDLTSDDFDVMVISGALVLPPEALAQLGDLEELQALTDADLAEFEALNKELGGGFAELSLLDGSGLGDGGFGMHMELDFSAFFGAFGAPPDGEEPPPGLAMNMYAFFQGERVLMVMVMWPTDRSPGVDARALAEVMDSRS